MKKRESNKLTEQILLVLENRKHSSLRGIAPKIGLSSTWFRKRTLKMRREGIIESWQLVLNPSLYQQRIFFLLLKTNPNEPTVVSELLNNYDQGSLSTLEGITGEFSLFCRFHFPSTTEFLDSLDHLYGLIGETGFQKYQMIEVIKVHKERGIFVPEMNDTLKPKELKKLNLIQKLGESSDLPPSTYDIAEKLDESQPATYRRLKRWENKHIILGYSLATSYWQENYLHAYIQVKAPLGKYKSAIDFCLKENRIVHIYRTNQEYSLLLKTRHLTLSDLNDFLKSLYKYAEVEDTLTRIVLDNLRG